MKGNKKREILADREIGKFWRWDVFSSSGDRRTAFFSLYFYFCYSSFRFFFFFAPYTFFDAVKEEVNVLTLKYVEAVAEQNVRVGIFGRVIIIPSQRDGCPCSRTKSKIASSLICTLLISWPKIFARRTNTIISIRLLKRPLAVWNADYVYAGAKWERRSVFQSVLWPFSALRIFQWITSRVRDSNVAPFKLWRRFLYRRDLISRLIKRFEHSGPKEQRSGNRWPGSAITNREQY